MGLLVPPWYFNDCSDNLTGTPVSGTPGTGIAAGTSSSDGTSTAVLTALAHDVHFLVVALGGYGAAGVNANTLFDVLVDPAGGTSWTAFINDLVCGMTPPPATTNAGIQVYYYFPVFIKSGTSVGGRARQSGTGAVANPRVMMWAFGNPSRPDAWWCGSGVETLGAVPTSSQGTTITPGASGVAGTWTTIGTSTHPYGALQFGIQGPDGTATAKGGYWELGISSLVFPAAQTLYTAVNTAESNARTGTVVPIWCDIPSNTTFQMRGTLSGAAENYNGAVYGVY